MGGSIDMNFGFFQKTSVSCLKSVVLQLFPKYSRSYAYLNVKTGPKLKSH